MAARFLHNSPMPKAIFGFSGLIVQSFAAQWSSCCPVRHALLGLVSLDRRLNPCPPGLSGFMGGPLLGSPLALSVSIDSLLGYKVNHSRQKIEIDSIPNKSNLTPMNVSIILYNICACPCVFMSIPKRHSKVTRIVFPLDNATSTCLQEIYARQFFFLLILI